MRTAKTHKCKIALVTVVMASSLLASAVFASTASAFIDPTAVSTQSVDWRAAATGCYTAWGIECGPADFSTPIVDRVGNTIKNGEWQEFLWRYGDSTPDSLASSYSARGSTDKAFLDRIRDPSSGTQINQMSLWQEKEAAMMAKVESGSAGPLAEETATALWKSRAALGLGLKITELGGIAWGVYDAANFTEKALVAGENKLFGWHIQLRGPFGIFGSWNPDDMPFSSAGGSDLSSVTIENVKWRFMSANALCNGGGGTGNDCPVWDAAMDSATGQHLSCPSLNDPCLAVPVVIENKTNASGTVTAGVQAPLSALDVGYCESVGWNPPGSQGSADPTECNPAGSYSLFQIEEFQAEWKARTPEGGLPEQFPDGSLAGQYVCGSNCTIAAPAPNVAYVMTRAQFTKFFNGTNSYAWERAPKANENNENQGDSLQPGPTFVKTVTPIPAAPMPDATVALGQDAAQDGTDTGTASTQQECYSGGGGCADPTVVDAGPVPDCSGMTVVDCQDAIINAGYTGQYTTQELDWDHAAIGIDAGAVVSTDPAGGAKVDPSTTFTFYLNPDPMPFIVPDVTSPNETSTQYQTDLENAGLTGTITITQITDPTLANGQAGPDGVAQLINTTTGEVINPNDRIDPTTPITITENPPDMPTIDTGTSGCNCPPIDFSPLTGMGLGSKFPFGVFTYAASIIGNFNVTPHAPDFALNAVATGIGGTNLNSPYDVNLGDQTAGRVGASLNTYMGWWRELLSFCMWIGAIYWVGTRLLGFNAGGDPGAGMDEIL